MESIEGCDLSDQVRPGGIRIDELVSVIRPLAEALDYIHAEGIVHRDLKPANVKIRADGRPVLLDFGIAKDLAADGPGQTKTMTAMGTSLWMAPEQADAKSVTGAADIYALGMMAYVLLSGHMPWEDGVSEVRALTRKMTGKLIPLSEAKPGPAENLSNAGVALDRASAIFGAEQADIMELRADLALASGDWQLAEDYSSRGLALEPHRTGLAMSRIEAMAMGGRTSEAVRAVASLEQSDPDSDDARIHLARGLVRAGKSNEATQQINRRIKQTGRAGSIRQICRQDALLSAILKTPRKTTTSLSALRTIVAKQLPKDEQCWHGDPPTPRRANVKVWLRRKRGEKILWFYDWTMWGNGKGGFAITNRRVSWKCMFEDPVSFDLASLEPSSVSGVDDDLYIGDSEDPDCATVYLEHSEWGEKVASCLKQLVLVLQGCASPGRDVIRTLEFHDNDTRSSVETTSSWTKAEPRLKTMAAAADRSGRPVENPLPKAPRSPTGPSPVHPNSGRATR